MVNARYYSVEKLLSSSLLSKYLKVRIYKTVILLIVLYGCETWIPTLREEQRLRVFENKFLRKIFGAKTDEVTGEWRKLHNAELYALYSSPDIIRNIKSKRLRWAGHVARMGESKNAYRVLVARDCVKHVAMQRCHIAQLHDGLKRSGKALLHRYQREGDDFLGRIVAMDETWTRSYEPNLKRQSNEWKHPGSPRPKKVRPTQSAVKEMFIVAYDIDGVILHHAVPPRQTENVDYWNIHLKEPLRGTRYNVRDELIRALGRSIRNINKDGRADGVRRLPNIWQKLAKYFILQLISTTKHKNALSKATGKKISLLLTVIIATSSRKSQFAVDLCKAFLAAEIPLWKVKGYEEGSEHPKKPLPTIVQAMDQIQK
ncbi:hypothetical protein ANN_05894 [Periplaneta americana]|uniref:Uncharacterized protein n=1 Tax=Periplaneta americana TaxID=6978 RepID=A0ABQ8TEI3_PERAM|nr:hypothetical protein ANN_05894 [Periplaneta americana]